MKLTFVLVCLFLTSVLFGQEDLVTVSKVLKLMGTRFEVTVVAQNEDLGYININEAVAEITRIEKLISSWDSDSETSLVNKNAGLQPVKVSKELFNLTERSIRISEITDGAFDVSYAPMDRVWKFNGEMKKMPSKDQVTESVAKVNYQDVVLNKEETTIFLKEKGMKLGFGAIGKGYAADKTKELLISKGVIGGIINASGDLTTWGTKNTGEKWMVGITNPLDKNKMFSWLPVIESSVATSGNYEKYVVINDEKFSHIIDPRTGYPTKGVKSVTVFAKKAELCDALSTAVFVMGKDSGIHMVNQLPGVEVVVIDDENEIYKSKGIIFDSSK